VTTTSGDVELGRGAIFVPLARQDATPAEIHAIMETIAAEDGVPVYAATSGLTPITGRDLGATRIFPLAGRTARGPRIRRRAVAL
jgi:hypothetical protein